jgi:hypothetical protein
MTLAAAEGYSVERLLAAICTGTAGAVLALEASRLAAMGAIGTLFWSSALW